MTPNTHIAMKRFLRTIMLLLLPATMAAQFSISGTTPVNQGQVEVYSISPPQDVKSIEWYSSANNPLFNESTVNVSVDFQNGPSDTLSAFGADWFNNPIYETFTVTVNLTVPDAPPVPTANGGNSGCDAVTLSVSGSPPNGVVWYWQDSATGESTDDSLSTFNANSSGRYYIRGYRDATLQWGPASESPQITVTDTPNQPNVSSVGTVCSGTSVQLSVSNPEQGVDYLWYNATGSTPLGPAGNSYNTGNLTANKTYRVRAKRGNCYSPYRSVTVTVTEALEPSVTDGNNTCGNSSEAILTAVNTEIATGIGGVKHWWYTDSSGGMGVEGTPVAAPQFTTTFAAPQAGTYYVSFERDGCMSARVPVTATFTNNDTPTLTTTVISGPVCENEDFTILASGGTSQSVFDWYENPTGGQSIHQGTTLTRSSSYANSNNGTVTYYVEAILENAMGCTFPISRTAVDVTILPPVTQTPTVNVASTCGSNTVTLTASGIPNATYRWYDANDDFETALNPFTETLSNGTTTFKVSAVVDGCEGPLETVSVTVGPLPGLATGNTSFSRCGNGSVALTATPGPNADTIRWFDEATGGTLLDTGTTYNTLPLTGTQIFYAESYNSTGECAAASRLAITANVMGIQVWYFDADGDGHASSQTSSCGSPGTGWTETQLPVDDCDDSNYDPNNDCTTFVDPNPLDKNYVYRRNYQVERDTPTAFFTADAGLIQNITYYDGLGRPSQQIGLEQSPESSGTKKDIVSQMKYDGYGRMSQEWLPVAMGIGSFGIPKTGIEAAIMGHYDQPKYENTTNPYTEKEFEDSPLNRLERQAAPGSDWALGEGHEIEFDYAVNTNTDNVPLFSVTTVLANKTHIPTLVKNGTYGSGELYKTTTRDENHDGSTKNHTVEEFSDRRGRVLLKRTYADTGGQTQVPHDTYYVYDDFGNLTYVLPPKMEASTASLSNLQGLMNDLGYQYIYDYRNRLVEKRIPGKGWEYIVYNKLDQPIMTQDANMRTANNTALTANFWLFTKYDAFGRVAYTGKVNNNSTRSQIQNTVDALTGAVWVARGSFTDGGIDVGYANTAYPINNITEVLTVNYYDDYNFDRAGTGTSQAAFGVNSTVRVKGMPTGSKVRVLDPTAGSGPVDWITTVTFYDEKTRPIYVYSNNEYLNTVDVVTSKLDFVGRPLQVRTAHTRGTTNVVTLDNYTYDHAGRLLSQTQCIGDNTLGETCPTTGGSGGMVDIDLPLSGNITTNQLATKSITLSGTATVSGTVTLEVDPSATGAGGSGQELIVQNFYDDLGQLTHKNVGGDAAGNGLQTVDYEYNVRGWLEGINDSTPHDNTLTLNSDDLWGFRIKYNDVADASKRLYNGNISETLWDSKLVNTGMPPNPVSQKYTYTHDAMNRLLTAVDNTNNYTVDNISYDKNGNIMSLARRGQLATSQLSNTFGQMDDLVYAYDNGNKLTSVDDTTNGNADFGFIDRAETTDEYSYDANGNMTRDNNKGITGITYNYLNLPTNITVSNTEHNGSIDYVYDATGTKLKKSIGTTVTLYAGNHVYGGPSNTEELQFLSHSEGYISPNTNGYDYIYQFKDHLGNVRLSYTLNNGVKEIIEENNYYPFGLQHRGYKYVATGSLGNDFAQKWKFGGKEHEDSFSLDLYDYGWRLYDAVVGKWNGIDPYSEIYEDITPYNYSLNAPITTLDPDGRLVVYVNGFRVDAYSKYIAVITATGGRGFGQNTYSLSVPPTPWVHDQRFFDTDEYNYWVDFTIKIGAPDERRLYVDGMDAPSSTGMDRFNKGIQEGEILADKIKSGEITLEDGETIKLVGHSHGGAHAMGMAQGLLNAGIPAELIDVLLFAPHQPNQIPSVKVRVFQFSRKEDLVSSDGILSKLFGKSDFERIKNAFSNALKDGNDDDLGNHGIQTYTADEIRENNPELFNWLVNQGIIYNDGSLNENN